jgi:tetratricopeptide (TPR) repeat protein
MASAGEPLAAVHADTVAVVRRLWEDGRRGPAVRAALEGLDHLLRRSDDLRWLAGALRSCGLGAPAYAVQLESTKRAARPAAWEDLIRDVLESRDPWWAHRLLAEAGGDSRELQALRIETELACGDPAPLIAAWVRTHRDEAALEAAVRWWVRSDHVEEAARLVDGSDGLVLWRARLALWRNRPDLARPLLATLAPDAEVRCLEAIASILDGDLAEAIPRLQDLVHTSARAEAWTWLATAFRKQRRYAEAVAAADAAAGADTGFNFVARLERELASDHERTTGSGGTRLRRLARSLMRVAGRPRMHRIEELENARALYPLGLRPRDSIAVLESALERFAGNHTLHLSTVERDVLRSYPLPENPRQLGSMVQLVLWTRGADAARALYDELAPGIDDHPLYRIYHGELELWVGAYDKAERIFRRILGRDDRVRWAWIGLGASVMFQGDLREAQKIWKRGVSRMHRVPGPTLYVYRGECYRRQGEIERARRELETGLRQKPHRLSAHINLALLDHDPEALARVEKACTTFAPLLMSELTGGPAERLEQVLEAMRGNRSSSEWSMSYHLWGHLWRRGVP